MFPASRLAPPPLPPVSLNPQHLVLLLGAADARAPPEGVGRDWSLISLKGWRSPLTQARFSPSRGRNANSLSLSIQSGCEVHILAPRGYVLCTCCVHVVYMSSSCGFIFVNGCGGASLATLSD